MKTLPFFRERCVTREARGWMHRIEKEKATPADNAAFMAWLVESPQHVKAILRMPEFREGLAQKIESGEWMPPSLTYKPMKRQQRPALLWQRHAFSSTIVLAAGAALVMLYIKAPSAPATATRLFVTEMAAKDTPETLTLPDGSTLELNRHSQARVSFDQHIRRINLFAGELQMIVSHDPRPLQVQADGTSVTATGTRFAVRLLDLGMIDVAVAEGSVNVARSTTHTRLGRVKAGQIALSGPNGFVKRAIDPVSLSLRMTFQDRSSLQFRNAPLEQVIAGFNSIGAVQLRIAEPGALGVRVSGEFDARDLPGLIQGLKHMRIRATAPDRHGVIELSKEE
jgi:transmembrane sensor